MAFSGCARKTVSDETPYTTPDWFKEAVLYEIFVRSFRDSNGDGIGDLKGVTQSLNYLQSLGVTAIWLTPIFPSPSHHGYDVTNYFNIRPEYGTKEDLAELVNAAHQRGMRILLDYVVSHTSSQHPFFKDAYGNPASQYSEYYLWKDEEQRSYRSYQDVLSMPTVNHGSAAANQYFIDVAKYWMDLDGDGDYSDGIDGWRCDYAIGTPEVFWRDLRTALKAVNPDVLLLGEVWVREPAGQAGYFKDGFDAQFDFPLYFVLGGDPAIRMDGLISGNSVVSLATDRIRAARDLFDPNSILVRFLNNHDLDRAASEVQGDPARLRLGALLLATLDGVPMIYYGEEIGMQGMRGTGPYYDEYRREPMEWSASLQGEGMTNWFKAAQYIQPHDGISVEEQEDDPQSLLNFYRRVYALRKENPALLHGEYTQLEILPKQSNVWAFWRYTENQVVLAFFNFGETEAVIQPDLSQAPGKIGEKGVNLLTGDLWNTMQTDLLLPPASGFLFDLSP